MHDEYKLSTSLTLRALSRNGAASDRADSFDRALQPTGGQAEYNYNAGVLLLRMGRTDEAERSLRCALDPTDVRRRPPPARAAARSEVRPGRRRRIARTRTGDRAGAGRVHRRAREVRPPHGRFRARGGGDSARRAFGALLGCGARRTRRDSPHLRRLSSGRRARAAGGRARTRAGSTGRT
ncbi:MAG: hypothetical protein WKH64_02615 [Chloroflexia bacterium]